MSEPTAEQILYRNNILEKAKERLIEKEAKYLESLSDMDVKLVVDKTRQAVIEQGRTVSLHQKTLEEHKVLVEQANKRCYTALEEMDLLREELKKINDKLEENNNLVRKITDLIEIEIYNTFWYKFKAFFAKLKRNKQC